MITCRQIAGTSLNKSRDRSVYQPRCPKAFSIGTNRDGSPEDTQADSFTTIQPPKPTLMLSRQQESKQGYRRWTCGSSEDILLCL